MKNNKNGAVVGGVALCIGVLLSSCAGNGAREERAGLTVETVSTPAHLISGADALVRISGRDLDPSQLAIAVNGTDVSKAFRSAPADKLGRDSNALLGKVANLVDGENDLVVRLKGKTAATLRIVNHPIVGPILSGPHQQPFSCQTVQNGLGEPLDANCSAKTVVTYVYKSTEPPAPRARPGQGQEQGQGQGQGQGQSQARAPAFPSPTSLPSGFKTFDPTASRPADLAQTTTSEGKTVDYIVRRERGTINRSVYDIAFLHVPDTPLPTPWTTSPSWNGRLVYSFGGGCAAGYRQALLSSGNALMDSALSKGYAVAAGSLNAFGNTCDDVISAETAIMVKEYFVEQFGAPVHTIGFGGSGGSMQQHLIAQNYPGVLDGLTPTVSFSDQWAVVASSADCSLLAKALADTKESWTDEQKRAVSGFATWRVCGQTWALSNLLKASNCDRSIPKDAVYDAEKNPGGARCGIHDNMVNQFGRDPKTGVARRAIDNMGVQYGLVAFNAGEITAAQFIELNERIGGHDVDGNVIATRNVADPEALRRAHAGGRLNSGVGALGSIPIIDSRPYTDPTADIHDSYRSFVTRARIAAANKGRADNHVILRTARGAGPGPGAAPDAPRSAPLFDSVALIDEWLTKLAADRSKDSRAAKLAKSKPAGLVDACWTDKGEKIVEPAMYSREGRCNQLYPPFGDPRIAAGEPLTDNILKCALKPVSAKDYKQSLSKEQLAKLKAIFPKGVCDYSRPGVEQAVAKATWQRF